MTGRGKHPEDPHWDLALTIAGKLWLYGEHVIEIDPVPTQGLVDLQWAARQAGRLIGVRTELQIEPVGLPSPKVLVRITYSDPDGRGLIRAQDGLDALVRSVREQQVAQEQVAQQQVAQEQVAQQQVAQQQVRLRRSLRPPSSPS